MKITKLELRPGVWRLRAETKDEFKQRKFFYYKATGTAEDADAMIQELLLKKPFEKPKTQKVNEYFEQWLEYRIRDKQIKPQTAWTYRTITKPVFQIIGDMQIDQLNRELLNSLYKRLLAKYPAPLVRTMSVVLSKAIRDAVQDAIIETDPTVGTKKLKARREPKTTTFTPEQIKQLLESAKQEKFLGPIIRFLLATGLRRGELCALQKQDVDLNKCVVHVRRNFAFYDRDYHLGGTKTKSSNRIVALPEDTRDELKEILKDKKPTDYVFKGQQFAYIRPPHLTNMISRFLSKNGFDQFTCHDLRHAHASFLIQQRSHPKAVSQRLGHADVKTTLSIYSHVLPGDDEILAQKIGSLF